MKEKLWGKHQKTWKQLPFYRWELICNTQDGYQGGGGPCWDPPPRTVRPSVRGRALPFCRRTLKEGFAASQKLSVSGAAPSAAWIAWTNPAALLFLKKRKGRAWRGRAAPALQVALPLQMWMLLMSTWRLLFEIQWGAKITVSLLRNVRRMFIISERVFVQWTDDGNGKWKAYADKHRKKAFFSLSFEQWKQVLEVISEKIYIICVRTCKKNRCASC